MIITSNQYSLWRKEGPQLAIVAYITRKSVTQQNTDKHFEAL
jgi:hypothetical protein